MTDSFTQILGEERGSGRGGADEILMPAGKHLGHYWVEKIVCRPEQVDAVTASYCEEISRGGAPRFIGPWLTPAPEGEVIITIMYVDADHLAVERASRQARLADGGNIFDFAPANR